MRVEGGFGCSLAYPLRDGVLVAYRRIIVKYTKDEGLFARND
jgi:hypothetical protein